MKDDGEKQEKIGKKTFAIAVLAIIISASVFSAYYFISDNVQEPYNQEEEPDDEPIYLHNISSGTDDFWLKYPTGHTFSGTSLTHPSWVLDDLQTRPLMIFTHSEGCAPCIKQTGICESIYAKYSADIKYYDFLSGTDEPEATDTFTAYDPDGEPHFIPLTIIVTKGSDGAIIWHSWEGVVEELILEGWIKDAIAYHGD